MNNLQAVRIRLAKRTAKKKILYALRHGLKEPAPQISVWVEVDDSSEYLIDPPFVLKVRLSAGKCEKICIGVITARYHSATKQVELLELGVTYQLQGLGIGTIMLRLFHAYFRILNYERVTAYPGNHSFCAGESCDEFIPLRRTPCRTTTPDNRSCFYEKNGYLKEEGGDFDEKIVHQL